LTVCTAPLIRFRPWRYINLLTYLLTYCRLQYKDENFIIYPEGTCMRFTQSQSVVYLGQVHYKILES